MGGGDGEGKVVVSLIREVSTRKGGARNPDGLRHKQNNRATHVPARGPSPRFITTIVPKIYTWPPIDSATDPVGPLTMA